MHANLETFALLKNVKINLGSPLPHAQKKGCFFSAYVANNCCHSSSIMVMQGLESMERFERKNDMHIENISSQRKHIKIQSQMRKYL